MLSHFHHSVMKSTDIFQSNGRQSIWKEVRSGDYQNSYVHDWMRVTKRAVVLLYRQKVADWVPDLMERHDFSPPALLPDGHDLTLRYHWENFHHQCSHPVKQRAFMRYRSSWEWATLWLKALSSPVAVWYTRECPISSRCFVFLI